MKIDPKTVTSAHDMHEIMAAIIMPRPIAWVSTVGADGVFNLAPFSFFTCASIRPPLVCFAVGRKSNGGKKDTLTNVEASKDFVVNIVDEELAPAMSQTSAGYPPEVDEFHESGLTPVKADVVKAPLVAESPMSMECELRQILTFGENSDGHRLIIGEVVRFHIRDDLYASGQIDVSKLRHIGRLGGEAFYCRTTDRLVIPRPPKS
jgi:flavin reductase (DIM6/NTAB) family NADH-FMN oxidoreductase RutF